MCATDETDYESLPANSPVFAHMIAGATAGILEHCVMYPVDCVKVGYQNYFRLVFFADFAPNVNR